MSRSLFPANLSECRHRRGGTEEACLEALKQKRWPEGFRCPKCGHDR
ncbi:transposase, partial [Acidithiobacillus caldus]